MTEKHGRRIIEELEVGGSHLVDKVKELIEEGNVRQLKIQAKDGDVHLEMPLTFGVVAGGAMALAAPWLAILGVIAAMVAKVQIEVEREVEVEDETESVEEDEEEDLNMPV